ncbi:putative prohead protease [uncultured virus]|uniref:Putative prohead protease n=1 Tax=uncultured virus TaxID=340016 RepID=A0A218MMT7_9VIRU|nr:putative prohead protease [uncultured virus]
MLLQEYRPFKVNKTLAEQAIKKNKPLIVSGVLQRAEAKNQNGRIYPRDILEREIKSYMEGPVAENRAMGELDHPESSVINLQNVSHNIKKCWWDGDDVMGDVEILNTPAGNILKALFAAGITVGISSRGMGSVEENLSEGTVEVQDDFELLCWDFVSTPSTHGAFMMPKSSGLHEGKIQIPEYKYTNINNIIRDIICDNTGMCKC